MLVKHVLISSLFDHEAPYTLLLGFYATIDNIKSNLSDEIYGY